MTNKYKHVNDGGQREETRDCFRSPSSSLSQKLTHVSPSFVPGTSEEERKDSNHRKGQGGNVKFPRQAQNQETRSHKEREPSRGIQVSSFQLFPRPPSPSSDESSSVSALWSYPMSPRWRTNARPSHRKHSTLSPTFPRRDPCPNRDVSFCPFTHVQSPDKKQNKDRSGHVWGLVRNLQEVE